MTATQALGNFAIVTISYTSGLVQVNKVLMKVLELCDLFCAEASKAEVSEEAMQALSEVLEKNVFLLMNLMTVLDKKTPGLNLLVLRLDFNKFFSNALALPAPV